MYSYHIFMFPFQWELESQQGKAFGERFDMSNLYLNDSNNWINIPEPSTEQYNIELYNEKNYFYQFVHNSLYDSVNNSHAIIKHFERKEAYNAELTYEIKVKANNEQSTFKLKLKSICLDLFSTGTGILTFYLENHNYKSFNDIKRINQFGRRVYPPFLGLNNGIEATKVFELADYIVIKGLNGDENRYYEDFSNFTDLKPYKNARFIESLIRDLSTQLEIEPVVDDRMFTMCIFLSNEYSKKISDISEFNSFKNGNEWHEFIYVDGADSTCQNKQMQIELLKDHTYARWQLYGTLFGITRHSFMVIADETYFSTNILLTHFRTIYVRMVELTLLQRASVLKFSAEVTKLSHLSEENESKLAKEISSFYKAYIRFVNQIYYREVTAQEQGIDLYELLLKNFSMKDHVKDLDNEIGELHNYATLLEEKAQNRNLSLLTTLGAIFLAPTFIVGFFGMNLLNFETPEALKYAPGGLWLLLGFIITPAMILSFVKLRDNKNRYWFLIFAFLSFVASIVLPFLIKN